ncbi:31439_t:CDS:2, partial [Racocetra persica]
LVADKPFLADLDADKQKDSTDESMGLEDLGLNIKDYGTKVKLYKTGSDKRNFANKLHKNFTADETNDPNKLLLADLQAIAPNADPNVNDHFIFDTNFALPESEEEMQLICDELEAAKLDSVMAGRLLQEKIDQIADEKQTIVADIKVKEGEIEGLIGEILTKKRERLTAYNISKGFAKTTEDNRRSLSDLYQIQQLLYEIRYLENDGDATANSSITEENTALTEIETILEEAGYYGGTTTYLVSYFQNLAFVAGDPEKFDIPQAISRIKAGKYKDSEGKEQDVRLFGDLTKFKTHFENKEKLVKLTEWELEAKQAIEKALNQDDNQQEKLSQVKKHGKIADVERLIKKVFADGKIKSEFLEEIKKSDATLVDLKSLLQKEPKDIITYIARFEYNQLPDTGDEKNKQKTQKKRRIAKKLSKTNESELKDEELNESLCKIEIGELTIDNTKYYKADLSEITTSEQEEQTF